MGFTAGEAMGLALAVRGHTADNQKPVAGNDGKAPCGRSHK
jgi:hypothetical protein